METDLYDHQGRPVMYIADGDDRAIYTWRGQAVSYLVNEMIYGWRGKHIGWFVDGIIYDLNGYRVGYIKEKCPALPWMPYIKYIKYVKYVKYARYIPYMRPTFQLITANIDLEVFLSQDKV